MSNITPQVLSALKTDFTYCHLVDLELNGGTVRLTESDSNISWGASTYLGNGILIDIDNMRDTSEIRVNELSITLSASDQTVLAFMLQNNQIGRNVKVYRAILNNDLTVIPDPILLTWGEIVGFSSSVSNSDASVQVDFAGPFSDWERVGGRATTLASQNRFYPNDKGFEFASQVKDELKWGGK